MPLALFGGFAALAWWALDFMAADKPRAVERLDELKEPRKRRTPAAESALKQSDAMTKMLEKATPALAKTAATEERGRVGQAQSETGRTPDFAASRPAASFSA